MGLPTAVVYVRPQRYTKELPDREDIFTLSVFGEGFRRALAYMGTHSGRGGDKRTETGLTPEFVDQTLVEHNYPKKVETALLYPGGLWPVPMQ